MTSAQFEDSTDSFCVEEIDGCPDGERYIERKHGFIIRLEEIDGIEIVRVIGICSGSRSTNWSKLTIRPLTETEEVIAREMGIILE